MFRGFLHIVAVLALGILVGSLLFFGTSVASVVFRDGVLPSRTLAGIVNGAIIHRLAVTQGIVASVALLSLGYLAMVTPRATSRIAALAALIALLAVLYSGLILLPEISQLRFEIGDFDHILASKEAAHERFSELHSRYTLVAMIELFAGLLSLVLHSLWVWRRGTRRMQLRQEGEGSVPKKEKKEKKKVIPKKSPPKKVSSESSENVTGVEETPGAS